MKISEKWVDFWKNGQNVNLNLTSLGTKSAHVDEMT